MPAIILASGSPRRQDILRRLGLSFEILATGVSEEIDPALSPDQIVEQLALRKAQAASRHDSLVIASDTVVFFNRKIYNKPSQPAEAEQMLAELAGQTHQVFTGLCLLNGENILLGHEIARVSLRALSTEQIRDYVATGEPLDKAGAYAAQSQILDLVEKIEGDYYNVIGLPIELLKSFLLQNNIRLPGYPLLRQERPL